MYIYIYIYLSLLHVPIKLDVGDFKCRKLKPLQS